jgi:hypothetical protein
MINENNNIYDIENDHSTTNLLLFIFFAAPTTTLVCVKYLHFAPPFDPSQNHMEFCVLLNNLQIINRHRSIFPIVLCFTLVLFTLAGCYESTTEKISPDQEELADNACDTYKIRLKVRLDEKEEIEPEPIDE